MSRASLEREVTDAERAQVFDAIHRGFPDAAPSDPIWIRAVVFDDQGSQVNVFTSGPAAPEHRLADSILVEGYGVILKSGQVAIVNQHRARVRADGTTRDTLPPVTWKPGDPHVATTPSD